MVPSTVPDSNCPNNRPDMPARRIPTARTRLMTFLLDDTKSFDYGRTGQAQRQVKITSGLCDNSAMPTQVTLPSHDVMGRTVRTVEIMSIMIAAALLAWQAARIGSSRTALAWWWPVAIIAGILLAD